MTWSFINAISGKLANKWFPKDEIARATAFGLGFEKTASTFYMCFNLAWTKAYGSVNIFQINKSVSLLFIGNGLGYLIPPMIVTGPTNQSEFSNNSANWNDDQFRQEFLRLVKRLQGCFPVDEVYISPWP